MFTLEELCKIIDENFEEFETQRVKEAFDKSEDDYELLINLYTLLKEKPSVKEQYIDKKFKNSERLIPTPSEEKQKESQKDKLKNRLKIKD